MSMQQRRYRVDDVAILRDPLAEVPADETIRFSVNGVEYEIDLSGRNARGFWKALKPYTEAGRRVRRPARIRTAESRTDARQVRTWAREQGYDVSDKGRVPADLVARYKAALAETAA